MNLMDLGEDSRSAGVPQKTHTEASVNEARFVLF